MKRSLLAMLCGTCLLAITNLVSANPAIAANDTSNTNTRPLNVVVSIKPLHALVASVMAGIATPTVLIKGGASPHATSLRPSDARLLSQANIVFWTGDTLETFLIKPLRSLSRNAAVIALSKAPGITLRPIREKTLWQSNDHQKHDDHESHQHHADQDMHIWLSHHNALMIVRAVAQTLSKHDPANKASYQRNAKRVTARLAKLHQDLSAALAPVRHVPYVVFHDAYQYFEADYGLKPIGALSTHEARTPGAKHLSAMRKKVLAIKPRCIFAEPQFKPALIQTLIDGTATKAGTLDPVGARLAPGAGLYDTLMRNLARDITTCLASTI
ncbi:MAG: zinc ABC transporter substrate-binding protein [Rhodospirillales bacterium]|jgi:zinc transport system substrate-binding protein